ncbi:MAG TPA: fibro-slime domain-containing protein [Fibrobacteria bacterium]|nr:fibro-slime domain-containing protein [Fibrobacteria bacterium]
MPSMVPTLCALVFGASAAAAQTHPAALAVTAKVRDFKEISPSDTAGAHPHFNNRNGCSAQELGVFSVQSDLDASGPADGGTFPGDNRTPRLMDSLPSTLAKCYSPPDRFSEWFSDKPGINRAFLVEMRFLWDEASGMYKFGDKAFFPIDAGKAFTPVNPGESTFGNLQPDTGGAVNLSLHDYGFTMEMHADFTYLEGQGQKVSISGDDDIWLFLNGKRVVDLGGVHQLQSASADLDSLKGALGLVSGQTYAFDFYFAERHVASSSCTITTNLAIGTALAAAVRPKAAFGSARSRGPVSIYDRSGRLVRTVNATGAPVLAAAPGGWDRLDAQGRAAVPGVYFWRMAGSGPEASGSIVLR